MYVGGFLCMYVGWLLCHPSQATISRSGFPWSLGAQGPVGGVFCSLQQAELTACWVENGLTLLEIAAEGRS